MGPKRNRLVTFLGTLALPLAVKAQVATGAAVGAPPGASAATAPAPAEQAAPPALPPAVDAMLEPVPPPTRVLASWKDALRLVRDRSTALRIARAQREQAAGQRRRALAGSLPKLSGSGAANHHLLLGTGVDPFAAGGPRITSIPNPHTIVTGSLDFRQPLINFGAWYSIGTAEERERVAELSAADAQRTLLATVAQAAVGVVTSTRVTESSRVSLGSALATLDLTRRRAALGAASAVDVLRAEQEVALSRQQVVTGDEALRQAREALGASLGDTTAWGVSPDIRVEDLERTAGDICRVVDVESRADIQAARTAVHASQRDRNAIDFTYLPTLDLASSVGYTSQQRRSPNGQHVTWTAGAIVSWTLYDGGDRYGQRQSTEAALTVAREQLTQKQRDAVLQVTQAERAIQVAQANVAVATSTRDLAKESARLSRLAFMNGSGTSFDLVDSARRLREAEIDLLIKDFRVFQARLTAFLARSNCSI